MAQNNQQINGEEEETPFVEHQLQEWYKEGVLNEDDIQKRMEHERAPYGEEWGLDPELWDETGKWGCDERVLLPIQGPVHWSEMWNSYEAIGRDHWDLPEIIGTEPIFTEPLLKKHMDYLTGHESNIEWVKELSDTMYEVVINHTIRIVTGPEGEGHWETVRDRRICKVIRFPDWENNQTLEERVNQMLNDYRVLQELNHENVIKHNDYIPIPDTVTHFPFSVILMITELCDGSLLMVKTLFPEAELPNRACMSWFRQIVNGLKYLHDNRVVHMNIRPQNILLKFLIPGLTLHHLYEHPLLINNAMYKSIFKLSNFGLAVKFNENQPMVVTSGGNQYERAPELTANAFAENVIPVNGITCDIYSLGITLAQTFFGNRMVPHRANLMDFINQLEFFNETPQVVRMVRSMICDNPNERITLEELVDWCKPRVFPEILRVCNKKL